MKVKEKYIFIAISKQTSKNKPSLYLASFTRPLVISAPKLELKSLLMGIARKAKTMRYSINQRWLVSNLSASLGNSCQYDYSSVIFSM